MPSPQDNQAMIEAISSKMLGAPPQAAAPQQVAPQEAQQAPQEAPQQAPKSKTDIEKAQSKLQPKGEDGRSAEESVQFIKVGDREMTEAQILGTLGRYKDLNHRWQSEVAPAKGLIEMVKSMTDAARKAGADVKPEEAVKFIQSAVDAYTKNPQMGSQKGKSGDEPESRASDSIDEYSEWEKENAVKLPPGLRETQQTTAQLQQQIQQLTAMIQGLVNGAPQGQQAQQVAQQQLQQGQQLQSEAAVNMVRNNLTQAFQSAQLPMDEATKGDFRLFAMQRGYDFPDFIDPEMTAIVVNDYRANKNAPEMERLRAIHSKRQAFTGAAGATPGGGSAPAPAGDPMLNNMIAGAMSKRGMI